MDDFARRHSAQRPYLFFSTDLDEAAVLTIISRTYHYKFAPKSDRVFATIYHLTRNHDGGVSAAATACP